jgi:hypothetical protein
LLPPAVEVAVKLTDVLLLYVRVNCVVLVPCPLLSFGLTVIVTPLVGLEEATVNVRTGCKVVNETIFPLTVPPAFDATARK